MDDATIKLISNMAAEAVTESGGSTDKAIAVGAVVKAALHAVNDIKRIADALEDIANSVRASATLPK